MNPYNPKHNPKARRRYKNRGLQKPVTLREMFFVDNSPRKSKRLAMFKHPSFDVTEFQRQAHTANVKWTKTSGAFGNNLLVRVARALKRKLSPEGAT